MGLQAVTLYVSCSHWLRPENEVGRCMYPKTSLLGPSKNKEGGGECMSNSIDSGVFVLLGINSRNSSEAFPCGQIFPFLYLHSSFLTKDHLPLLAD